MKRIYASTKPIKMDALAARVRDRILPVSKSQPNDLTFLDTSKSAGNVPATESVGLSALVFENHCPAQGGKYLAAPIC